MSPSLLARMVLEYHLQRTTYAGEAGKFTTIRLLVTVFSHSQFEVDTSIQSEGKKMIDLIFLTVIRQSGFHVQIDRLYFIYET